MLEGRLARCNLVQSNHKSPNVRSTDCSYLVRLTSRQRPISTFRRLPKPGSPRSPAPAGRCGELWQCRRRACRSC
jgi:hypothetical protein